MVAFTSVFLCVVFPFVLSVELKKCMYIPYSTEKKQITIEKALFHEKKCYTQGIFLQDDILYESCGQYNNSAFSKYKYPEMELLSSKRIEDKYFSEGIAATNGTVVMLTWREHEIFLFNHKTLEIERKMTYPYHGWGATSINSSALYVTDGTNKIRRIAVTPSGVALISEFFVRRGNNYVSQLNDLSYFDKHFYINVYYEDKIVVVDPTTGTVDGEIWCNVKRTGNEEVMNGIATISQNQILVTGKYWDKMFLLRIE
ncbi:hypothetical protein EIN_053130 [Entamoeba invadens IP1]|uniref:hypothetical protein n=1 Tax=Entamoeba invadens IP1 TaxID=370355 RepID=UPI0002C3E247|nr:hypothetical protein EIN_053130 [Entamoeba invadens IP1]ELP93078.1 hypothetical protein EIN_053130 [Entamoeba invadens IP1]|eukprot:XP_004259849.1 hypothetical protein EIN_053130 [Entamoeba invadens IP1]